ncbi:hypothetical protein INT45_013614 [Circinella minor]|uniref:Uncharacterized protein n=1 Tax=Circinella minor TaxID=1195481 RepID=A0A8H7VDV6_9FUNG|nr:hypothetical protein INT45_013614 [Circinella minor]
MSIFNELQNLSTKLDSIVEEQSNLRQLFRDNQAANAVESPAINPPMGSQTIIPKPEPRLISGKKDYKVKKNDILELLNPKGTVSETQLKAISQVQDTPYAKSSWGDIPWEKKAGEVKAFEQLVKEKTGINIRCCEANWAADYLIGTSYNNSNGDKRRKEKRKGLEASIEDNTLSQDMNSFDSSNGGLRSVEDLNLMNTTQSHGEASGILR